jgi:hypothetical protein
MNELSFYGVATQVSTNNAALLAVSGGSPASILVFEGGESPGDGAVPAIFNLYRVGNTDYFALQSQYSGGYVYLFSTAILGQNVLCLCAIDLPWRPMDSPPAVATPSWTLDAPSQKSYDPVSRQNTYTGLIRSCGQPPLYMAQGAMGMLSTLPIAPAPQFQVVWFTLEDVLATRSSTFGSVALPFCFADLQGLSLGSISWQKSDFSHANLTTTDFSEADLSM